MSILRTQITCVTVECILGNLEAEVLHSITGKTQTKDVSILKSIVFTIDLAFAGRNVCESTKTF